MRRLKRSTAFLQSSRDCLRGNRAWPTGFDFARIKSRGRSPGATARLFLEGLQPPRTATTVAVSHYGGSLAEIRSRLIKAKNVWVASADMGQGNVVRRDIRLLPARRRLLALLSCDQAKGQECKRNSYGKCYHRLGREFHCDHVFCTDANSLLSTPSEVRQLSKTRATEELSFWERRPARRIQ